MSLLCDLQSPCAAGRTHQAQETVLTCMSTQIMQPQIATESTLKCVVYLCLAGCHFKDAFFPQQTKGKAPIIAAFRAQLPTEPWEHAVTALQTLLYRLLKGSLRLSSAEQEAGLREHEPAMCPRSTESQEHAELYHKKHCQEVTGGDAHPLLSAGETGLERVHLWAPQQREAGMHWREPSEIQSITMEIINGLAHLSYKERLRELGLLSLEKRWLTDGILCTKIPEGGAKRMDTFSSGAL